MDLVSAPKTTTIISKSFLLQLETKQRPALKVKPVFTPYTPSKLPNNSLVLLIEIIEEPRERVIFFVDTIFLKVLLDKA